MSKPRVCRVSLVSAGASADQIAAHCARVREYWTPERKASAVPPPGWIGAQEPALGAAPDPTRVPHSSLAIAPFSSVGKLFFQFEEGGQHHRASAFAVGSSLVMTAAHCVVDRRGPAINVLFDPQYDDGPSRGTYAGVGVYYLDDYATAADGAPFDFAFARIEPLPSGVPPLALDFREPTAGAARSLGYPIYKSGAQLWQSEAAYEQRTTQQYSYLRTRSLFTAGASGGPWLDTGTSGVVSLTARGGDGVITGPILGSAASVLWQAVAGTAVGWAQDTECGDHPTSVLYNGTPNAAVAGCNGYIYGYDAERSTQVLSNSLTGYGKNEARLASDGTYLYVGINGYVLALAYSKFSTVRKLAAMKVGGPTTLLWAGSNLYAGATAQVCRIANGAAGGTLSYNTLTGLPGGDVDLATDGANLYAGTGGQVTAIALADFESESRLWTSPITSSRGDVVGVMYANGQLWAGAGGTVGRVDPSTGAVTPYDLGLGGAEVRFAAGLRNIYAGCNGTVAAFDDLANGPLWQTTLSAGAGVVNLLHISDCVVAGCNGVVYVLGGQSGALLDTIALPGGVSGEVRLDTAGGGALLFAGCAGHAYSFSFILA